jgi:hypothetical protein
MIGSERATVSSFPRRLAGARSDIPAGWRLAARSAVIRPWQISLGTIGVPSDKRRVSDDG